MFQERMPPSGVPEARSGSGGTTAPGSSVGQSHGRAATRGGWASTGPEAPSACSGALTAQATLDRCPPTSQGAIYSLRQMLPTPTYSAQS